MFIINTRPLHSQKIMSQYGNFLLRRFILPYFHKGCVEVHLLLDFLPIVQHCQKVFEQARRDSSSSPDHLCFVFFDDAEIPNKWQDTLSCRQCKRQLTIYVSNYIVSNIQSLLRGLQKFVTSGATGTNHALEVTRTNGKSTSARYSSNVDESDTRIWLHAKFCMGSKTFILSPDTDVYHIGLPLLSSTDEVIAQLSRPSDKELNLLNLHILADLLQRDPDLAHILSNDVLTIVQSIFVCSGCDYMCLFSHE